MSMPVSYTHLENYLHVQWEAKLKADLDKMIELTDRLNSLHQKIVEDYKMCIRDRGKVPRVSSN